MTLGHQFLNGAGMERPCYEQDDVVDHVTIPGNECYQMIDAN